jgi:hypothetical protein
MHRVASSPREAIHFPVIPGFSDPGRLREHPITEHDVQRLWFEHLLPREFLLPDGRRVEILQTGWWNHAGGPDFRDAAVRFPGGPVRRGDVEFHLSAREWAGHGHHLDPAYNGVVLHIALTGSQPVVLASGDLVPTVDLSAHLRDPVSVLLGQLPPEQGLPAARPGRCCAALARLDPPVLRRLLADAGRHRLHLKAARLARQRQRDGAAQTLWEALAEAMGYSANKTPFRVLARRVPLASLAALPRILREARLLGTAGFLPRTEITSWPPENRRHAARLWNAWWPVHSDPALAPLPHALWNLAGARPANHPQRRIAALAALAPSVSRLVGALADWNSGALPTLRARHPFFESHATLRSRPAPRPIALIGPDRLAEIQFNVFLPWLLSQGRDIESVLAGLPAPASNRPLAIVAQRLFGSTRAFRPRTALEQQGLLHIHHGFCAADTSDCAACSFPEVVERWRAG